MTGKELDRLSDEEYLKIAPEIQVYARVKPTQKMKIVETLKKLDNIVAMTGDGVNDAPALKKASIGVAMGDGTDVAKEASDMILQNNDFTTIVKAIEGKENIRQHQKIRQISGFHKCRSNIDNRRNFPSESAASIQSGTIAMAQHRNGRTPSTNARY